MEYTATTKYMRISPRKMKLFARAVRGMKSDTLMASLQTQVGHAAKLFATTLASVIANAKQKKGEGEALWVKTVEVMEGPVMKRWHAVSRGTAHAYKKRMTHIKIVLSDEVKKKTVPAGRQE